MGKTAFTSPFPLVTVNRRSGVAAYRQIYAALREAVLSGRLRAGARLPATRTLASRLRLSRTTVVTAFEQLLAEGYLDGRVGSGTFVAGAVPDDALRAHAGNRAGAGARRARAPLSRRGTILAATPASALTDVAPRLFRPGLPALDAFPYDVWRRLVNRMWHRRPRALLSYSDHAGYRPLREAIAAYLREVRAVRCAADQVIVVAGSQQGLDLIARVLLDPGDAVWVEDPGYLGAHGALRAAGARIVPVPVDAEGLDVNAGAALEPAARLASVTPSHHYPLGATMSLRRRLALLRWAQRTGAWVLEDDYDSEYRYAGRPLASLQGLDAAGRVIYLGTFSKVLFPSLRLGYVVAPPGLVNAVVAARALVDRECPTVEQAVLAEFIAEGHFARHIRRMRTLYAERQQALLDAADRELRGLLDIRPSEAGMHLVGWLPQGIDDRRAAARAAACGVEAPALSAYRITPSPRGALLLGYTCAPSAEIRAAVSRLAAALAGGPEDARTSRRTRGGVPAGSQRR
ncbi:MAG TPA: PLP-dependent aminotransferase family protein [bacterium]|nr:PLP-dependent aminotransferase family protein [bacterium]